MIDYNRKRRGSRHIIKTAIRLSDPSYIATWRETTNDGLTAFPQNTLQIVLLFFPPFPAFLARPGVWLEGSPRMAARKRKEALQSNKNSNKSALKEREEECI